MARKFSPKTQKVLLLFAGGLALGLNRSSSQYFKIIKSVHKEWKKINRRELNQAIKSLYRSKMIEIREGKDETIALVINNAGKKKVLVYNLDEIKINKPKHWDGKWRIVVFDIPEKHKPAREALRKKLKELEFYQMQKSIFVTPYECEDEINFILEMFKIRPYARYIVAQRIDNQLHLKKIFDLI